ncbi:MAG: glycine cleavage system aminomethyltransferase GcvT [Roseobacter sp.]
MGQLLRTPLHDWHMAQGAKMVGFAGYEMPVQYPMGVMAEHKHTRARAGLFDVSHMGQVLLEGPSWEAVARAFEALVPQDVLGLADGRQRYGFFTNDAGGIEDDLMFARRGDALYVVVNAACKAADIARMQSALPEAVHMTDMSGHALLALQGPHAGAVLASMDENAAGMAFMDCARLTLSGHMVWASRSGYTGEDGFEVSVPADEVQTLAQRLCDDAGVAPIGLGARDSLRLEAGLCLFGNDIDPQTTPIEAGLGWAIQKVRRAGGARAGGYPGADVIDAALSQGPTRRRVGLQPEGRAPMRAGVTLHDAETGAQTVGTVTSGGFGPTVEGPIAMGYVQAGLAAPGTRLWGEVRGKRLPVNVVDLPFVPAGFKR